MLEIQQKDNMKRYIETIQKCLLFNDIEQEDLINLLTCMGAKVKTFEKEEYIVEENKDVTISGIVLSGSIQLVQYDYNGNRTILSRIEPLQLFGEANSFSSETMPTNIVAAENSTVLFIDTNHLSHPCGNHCKFHITLINNLLRIMATKNVGLNQKLQCISQRTTREKILNYLLLEAKKHKTNEFEIPFDRQSLADYLCVERSAMSAELSKLRNENVIESNKNKFKLLKTFSVV